MNPDQLSREAALQRVRQAGLGSGKWGAPASANPYANKPDFQDEESAWASGWLDGARERKGAKR